MALSFANDDDSRQLMLGSLINCSQLAATPPLELEDELELLLDEDELELDELELEELDVVLLPVPPLQLPAAGLTPLIVMLSMFARPALLVASTRMRLLPATRLAVTEADGPQVVHEPVASKAKLPTVAPFTIKDPERAVEPLA